VFLRYSEEIRIRIERCAWSTHWCVPSDGDSFGLAVFDQIIRRETRVQFNLCASLVNSSLEVPSTEEHKYLIDRRNNVNFREEYFQVLDAKIGYSDGFDFV
jgi:hypothetical protein